MSRQHHILGAVLRHARLDRVRQHRPVRGRAASTGARPAVVVVTGGRTSGVLLAL